MNKDFLENDALESELVPKISTEWEIQYKVFSILFIPQNNLLPIYHSYIKSNYWEDRALRDLVSFVLKHYKKTKTIPSILTLKHGIQEFIQKPTKKKLESEYNRIYDMLCADIISENFKRTQDFFSNLLSEFITKCHYKSQAIEILDNIDRGEELGKIQGHIDLLAKAPRGAEDRGLELYKFKKFENVGKTTGTLIEQVDRNLRGNGIGNELAMVISPANVGKSTILVRIGLAAIFQGATVFHYTLEMSAEDIMERYLRAFTGFEKIDDDDGEITSEVQKKLSWVKGVNCGDLVVKEYATGTVGDIESHMNQCMSFDKKPTLLIIDSVNYLQPNKEYFNMQGWEIRGRVYEELIALKKKYKIGIWGADHSKSNSHRKKAILIEHLGKFAGEKADIILTLCQTKKEEELNHLRIFFTKNRHGPKYKTAFMEINHAKMTLRERVPEDNEDIGETYDNENCFE